MRVRASVLSFVVCGAVVGAVLSVVSARAADDIATAAATYAPAPAVDGINGKVDGFGGSVAKRSLYGGEGALSVPLGGSYGLQIDGAGGSLGDSSFASTAGHLFWRDPSIGLLGGYVSYTHWDAFSGVNLAKYGAEGAWYAGRWTLEGVAGVESGSQKTLFGTNGITTKVNLATRGFDHVTASYYVNDNWKLSIGQLYTGGRNALSLGTEYGFALGGGRMGALFAEGRIGEAGSNGIFGGLKIYFGQRDKTLIRRNREDDPVTTTQDNLQGISSGTSGTPTTTAPLTCPTGQHLVGGVCVEIEP